MSRQEQFPDCRAHFVQAVVGAALEIEDRSFAFEVARDLVGADRHNRIERNAARWLIRGHELFFVRSY